ncbi:MAG: response regulator transcription factor [Planctomycetota bacterium]
MSQRLLLIEDDSKLARMVKDYLTQHEFDVRIAPDGESGLAEMRRTPFDAVILDLMLPDIDGLDVCRQLRAKFDTPVLMLTAKGDPMDRVVGLELGADDYMPKPFEPRELLARLRAILRRGGRSTPDAACFGRLEIHRDAMEAKLDGETCPLTAYQFRLLDVMSRRPGRVLSREFLMQELQSTEADAFDRSIDVHISRIRAAIEDDPKNPKRILTVRGTGYVFAKAQD